MNYTCVGIWAVIALVVIAVYYLRFANGYEYQEHDTLFFDPGDPGEVWEYKATQHQRTTGRERGSDLVWKDDD